MQTVTSIMPSQTSVAMYTSLAPSISIVLIHLGDDAQIVDLQANNKGRHECTVGELRAWMAAREARVSA